MNNMNKKNILTSKRGYLNRDFEFFYLKDQKYMHFEYHYHDFVKILIFISGKVTYLIEGKAYRLKPWDILLVGNEEIHKPIIEPGEIYERFIIWVNPAFIEKHNIPDCNLMTCFKLSLQEKYNLIRPDMEVINNIRFMLMQLENACKSEEFGSHILKNSILMQLIVHLNREYLKESNNRKGKRSDSIDIKYDKTIEKVLDYINGNLNDNLSIDNLSAKFYISKYYLMHKFKKYTGYSLHQYVLHKRLIKAGALVKKGIPPTQVCNECGFGDYSNFIRAFKKMYGSSPKEYYKDSQQIREQDSIHYH